MAHDWYQLQKIVPLLNTCIHELDNYLVMQHQDERANELALDLINIRDKVSNLVKDRSKTNEVGYGRCPACGGKGVKRERRPNGNDTCENGHIYPTDTRIRK